MLEIKIRNVKSDSQVSNVDAWYYNQYIEKIQEKD